MHIYDYKIAVRQIIDLLLLTWQSKKRWKLSAVIDPSRITCTRHPKVLIDWGSCDYAAICGGFLPILMFQWCKNHYPAYKTKEKCYSLDNGFHLKSNFLLIISNTNKYCTVGSSIHSFCISSSPFWESEKRLRIFLSCSQSWTNLNIDLLAVATL